MHSDPTVFFLVPVCFITQEMCIKAVEVDPWPLKDVLDHFKTQEICDKAVKDYLFSLQFVPDWLVTQQQADIGYDGDYIYNDDRLDKWYKGYKKHKAQKLKIKKDLTPIAWHPSRLWRWCISEDEKKETEKLFLTIWYDEIKNVLIKEDIKIWSKRGYN